MSALMLIAVGMALLGLAWACAGPALAGGNELAIVAALAAVAIAFNVVVPIPNLELTTTVVACAAVMLGVRLAAAVGVAATVGTGAVAGIGPWTPWQMLGMIAIALMASAVGRGDVDPRRLVVRLAALLVFAVPAYDALVTAAGIASVSAAGNGTLVGVLAAGIPFTIAHVGWSVLVTIFAGRSLLQALARARPRLEVSADAG